MDNDPHVIADLMSKLADARATLDECLSTLASDNKAARLEIAETLRQQIADTIAEIDAARLKVLKRVTAQNSDGKG
jgi:hypothetical protein